MISSRATVWSAKTQTTNGLRVTLTKKRNLQRDCSVGDQEKKEPPVQALHSVPRWTIESNRDPCKLTIKRRKTIESSDGNLENCLSERCSLIARTAASTKAQQDSESSLARIKNWYTEQISASLPSTCYDNFLAADVTMQPSPKCVTLETSLSGELFHLQPSPKDSGIDVSSPPRRFDEVHLTDMNGHSAAGVPSADIVSVASPNATVSRKPSRANVRFEKTFCVKQQTREIMEGTSAKDISVKMVCSSNSQRPWNLRRRQSHSKKFPSGVLPVEEDHRLLLRLPTSAFKAELTGTVNKRISRNQRHQMDGEHVTISNNIDSDCATKMIPKCEFVQNKETEEIIGKHCESKCAYSVSGHRIRSKTPKQKRLRSVQDADLRVNDDLKVGGNLIIFKNRKVIKKDIVTSAKFDESNEKQTTVDQSDENVRILDGDHSFTETKASRNLKTYSRNASKQADNKNKRSNNKTLMKISAVTELEEITDGLASGTFNNGRNVESDIFDGHTNTTDEKCLDFSDGVDAKVELRLSPRNQRLSRRGVDISGESSLPASVDCHNVTAKTVESVPVGEKFSRTSSDLDGSVAKEHSSEKFGIKRSSRLAIGTAGNEKTNHPDQDCLTVELVESVPEGENFSRTSSDLDGSVAKENSSEKFGIKKSSRLAIGTAGNENINHLDQDRLTVELVESVPEGEHFSRTSSDLDGLVAKENSSEKFGIKRSSRLAIGTAVTRKKNRPEQDRLSVELSLREDACLEKAEHVTVAEVIKTGVSSASNSVQLHSKRLTRSSANKLSVIFNAEIPASEPKLKDPTHPLDASVLNVASRSLTDIQCETRKQPLCSDPDDSVNSKTDAIATDGLQMHEDFSVKSFKLESAKTELDVFSSERPKRSNPACLVKKRHAGSRNSASRRSFERLSNSKELWKLPAEENLSTSAESETRNDNTYQEDIVSLNFERLDKIENDMNDASQHSDCKEVKMEPSEFCRFSAKKSFEDELLLEISFGEEDKALNRENMTTCFSSSFKVSSGKETTQPHSESLTLQDIEDAVDPENQFQSTVLPLELSSSTDADLSLKPDLKPKSVSIPTNNYISEFAKFVSIQHLDSFDSCSSEDGVDFCISSARAEESPLFPFKEDPHLETQTESSFSFCESIICEAEPEFNDDLPNRNLAQLCLQESALVRHEFDSARSCSSDECVVLSEDDKSTHCVSMKNVEDLEISSSSFQTNMPNAVGSFRGATYGVSDGPLISENFSADSVMSIDRELTSLQSKVAQLIQAVFPGLSQVHKEQHFLALPQFLDQVLDTVLGAADNDNDAHLQECYCDCQVNLCRNPLDCLKRLQSKVLRLIHFLLPSSKFEDVGAGDIEPLVEAVTLANSATLEVQESLGNDSEHCNTSLRLCS